MIRLLLLCATLLAVNATPAQPVPEVATGRIERLPQIVSIHVDVRAVDVWLPADYSAAKRYDVLCMQDGQMLFDAAKSWNQQASNVHLAVDRPVSQGRIADTIVVGIWNNGVHRYSEYYPQKFLPFASDAVRRDYVERAQLGRSRADDYLRFIVEELKPAIDRRYATNPGREHTFVMGSSIGGLVSPYAICEYPQVFGAAAALSTHWVGRPSAWGPPAQLQNADLPLAAFSCLRRHLPDPATHRLYMDHGTQGLDAVYGVHQAFVDEIVRERGFGPGNALSRVFEGTGDNERDWSARLDIPLLFMMGCASIPDLGH